MSGPAKRRMLDDFIDLLALQEYLSPVVEGTQEFRASPKRSCIRSGCLGLRKLRHDQILPLEIKPKVRPIAPV
jgi:hypothetical protein